MSCKHTIDFEDRIDLLEKKINTLNDERVMFANLANNFGSFRKEVTARLNLLDATKVVTEEHFAEIDERLEYIEAVMPNIHEMIGDLQIEISDLEDEDEIISNRVGSLEGSGICDAMIDQRDALLRQNMDLITKIKDMEENHKKELEKVSKAHANSISIINDLSLERHELQTQLDDKNELLSLCRLSIQQLYNGYQINVVYILEKIKCSLASK